MGAASEPHFDRSSPLSHRTSQFAFLLLFLCWALKAASWAQPFPTATPVSEPAPTPTPVQQRVLDQVRNSRDVPPELSTPRATLNTFRDSMASAYPFSVPRDALKCLDLSQIPPLIRSTGGAQRAIKLYEVLTSAHFSRLAVPTESEGDLYVLYRQPSGDRIALARDSEGAWKFDSTTIAEIERMNETLVKKGSINNWVAPHLSRAFMGLYFFQWGLLILPTLLVYLVGKLSVRILRRMALRKFPQLDSWAPPGGLRAVPWLLAGLSFTGILTIADLPLGHLVFFTALAKTVNTYTFIWFGFGVIDIGVAYIPRFRVYKKASLHNAVLPMAGRTLKFALASLGLLFLAQNLNINVWSLFAGFSVVGAMVALAGQDFVKNLFGSITVVLDQPFNIGDWVVIDKTEGTVEEVGFRSTRVRTFYNSLITIPNSIMLTATVDNYGARKFRRYKQMLHISHQTPQPLIEAFCEGIREIVRRHPYTRKDSYQVVLNDVTPDALQILLYIFWDTPDWNTELRERHRFLSDVLLLASRLGVELAPSLTRVQMVQPPPPGPSDRLYDAENYRKAEETGCDEARRVVTAVIPENAPAPPPVEILSQPRVFNPSSDKPES